ncbi:hypothetical protein M404DRAFT_36498 [Pisolithus tinctorius Marx 270]|uniref:Uncharacterized protein n=1 Tax=Pisolithus tinctorius Marx 270 TaxID=870435 RepID=A0A0C3NAQ5_PISTI|nr:hypothetical protein M404DRAFT_36498 [Pisolithus tinctorius Marx 270]
MSSLEHKGVGFGITIVHPCKIANCFQDNDQLRFKYILFRITAATPLTMAFILEQGSDVMHRCRSLLPVDDDYCRLVKFSPSPVPLQTQRCS